MPRPSVFDGDQPFNVSQRNVHIGTAAVAQRVADDVADEALRAG